MQNIRAPLPQRLNVQPEAAVLVFAANDDNRRSCDRIVAATQGKYPVRQRRRWVFFSMK